MRINTNDLNKKVIEIANSINGSIINVGTFLGIVQYTIKSNRGGQITKIFTEYQQKDASSSVSVSRLVLKVTVNDEVKDSFTYYFAGNGLMYTSYAEARHITKVQNARIENSRDNEKEIAVNGKNVQYIRSIPGWKSVAIKNIRLHRVNAGYMITNKTNKHTTIVKF